MQNEYQLRLKDVTMNERIKELSDQQVCLTPTLTPILTLTQVCLTLTLTRVCLTLALTLTLPQAHELEADKAKFELLLQEKNEQEMEYEEKLKAGEERFQASMASQEAGYQSKIMSEVERYHQLQQEKEMLNERWDEQNSLLVESHERVIQELTEVRTNDHTLISPYERPPINPRVRPDVGEAASYCAVHSHHQSGGGVNSVTREQLLCDSVTCSQPTQPRTPASGALRCRHARRRAELVVGNSLSDLEVAEEAVCHMRARDVAVAEAGLRRCGVMGLWAVMMDAHE